MTQSHPYFAEEEALDAEALVALQRRNLAGMLAEVVRGNAFYRRKLSGVAFDAMSDTIESLPLTTRAELERDQVEHPPFGTNLTYPIEQYSRFHQTSGSTGRPMRWLDTPDSWAWVCKCWGVIFTAAGVGPGDRLIFPFSFGPFLGFWGAFESSVALGYLSLPAGGMSTEARLRMIVDNAVTVVCCTPTYALRIAEAAAAQGIDLAKSTVRVLIVAGEPGGSIPATRQRIESAWGARVFDHTGMTEIGAISFECKQRPGEGVHLIESECLAEVIDPSTLQPASQSPDGVHEGELVLTNLGRWGSPLIRYRTGDHVRLTRGRRCACGRWFARLEGGILGRVDDMFIVRGNNVFPGAVEAVLRRFPEVAEFRVTVAEPAPLTRVRIEIEPSAGVAESQSHSLGERVGGAIQEALSFRADVDVVAPGTLPRFEMKARRFVRQT